MSGNVVQKGFLQILSHQIGKKMQIFSKKPAAVNVDGECEYVEESTFRILEGVLPVIVPDMAAYRTTVGEPEPETETALLK